MKVSISVLVIALLVVCVRAWGSNEKVRLRDVDVITLYSDKQTKGRRSSPIPQLQCVGGNACQYFKPQVVQCYNRGSDGDDVQWECKADMDNAYRFGKISVSCEGYDYPEDPYILKGSCGLEYTLELTKEGQDHHHGRGGGGGNSYQGNQYSQHSSYPGRNYSGSSSFGNVVFLALVAGVIYYIYKSCVAAPRPEDPRQSPRYPRANPSAPPPPGFRPEYTGPPPSYDDCTSGSYTSTAPPAGGTANPNAGGGNFWSGAATGGILGYLFGSRTGTHYHHQPRNYGGWSNGWGTGWGSGWGNRGWGSGWGNNWGSGSSWGRGSGWGSGSGWGRSSSSSSSRSSSSSGTRTASGFGGTTRR